MFSRGGFDAIASRRKPSGSKEAVDALVALADGNPDKALVMKYVGQFVANGHETKSVCADIHAEKKIYWNRADDHVHASRRLRGWRTSRTARSD